MKRLLGDIVGFTLFMLTLYRNTDSETLRTSYILFVGGIMKKLMGDIVGFTLFMLIGFSVILAILYIISLFVPLTW